LSYFYLYIVFHCTLSFRASSKVLRSFLLVGAGLISWVPHFTTGIGWALRVGLYCLQKAQYPLDAQWVCIADFTIQIGSKKALIVLRVPLSILSQGKALTLKQVEVIGLSLGEPWNGERVKTSLLSLFEGCGWPSHVVSDCGSDIKKGIADTLLKAPKTASWISDITHVVANALKHYYADLSLFQQFQTLCTRIRGRLQQTKFAFLLPPKARAKGRFLSASRQAQWGLQTLAYLEAKEREASPDVSALAQALRGLKSFKLFLMTFVRNTQCLNEVMKIVKTQGLRAESIHACQETLGALPARSPIRKEVSHYLQHYLPVVESSDSPLLGSSDVIESLIGKAKQRLEANGRSELNKSILLIPCMCGELTQDLVAEALTTVRVQDVTTWVSENVGETMQSKRRREFPRSQPQKPGAETAELFADTGEKHSTG
jgi:hypothetical protein